MASRCCQQLCTTALLWQAQVVCRLACTAWGRSTSTVVTCCSSLRSPSICATCLTVSTRIRLTDLLPACCSRPGLTYQHP